MHLDRFLWAATLLVLPLAGCLGGYEPVTVEADPAAPVIGTGNLTVYLFEDYQCSHCNHYALDGAYQHLLDTWVAPGDITVVFKHVAFVGPYSEVAAIASRCVAGLDSDAWPAFDHDIYAKQREGWQPTQPALKSLASAHGLDGAAVDACIAAGDPGVAANTQELGAMGQGTPTIVIDGIPYSAADTAAVDDAISKALA